MTIEEMQKQLTTIVNQTYEFKLANIILGIYNELKQVEEALDATNLKVQEIAAALNSSSQSDNKEEGQIAE